MGRMELGADGEWHPTVFKSLSPIQTAFEQMSDRDFCIWTVLMSSKIAKEEQEHETTTISDN